MLAKSLSLSMIRKLNASSHNLSLCVLVVKVTQFRITHSLLHFDRVLFRYYASKLLRDMPTIVHFEIPVDDIDRAKKFYIDLFGWNIERWPDSENLPGGPEYLLITTMDDKGNKALTGGMMKRQMPEQQGITNYVGVKSVDEYSARVAQLGGQVKMPKTAIPGLGYFAICIDTGNNAFAIWETDSTAK